MILKDLKSRNIRNIVIFVCDSLRWDYIPQSIVNMGITIKTVASSLYTATSFPSMISGLYPPKTGVHTWDDLLPKSIRGLLDLDGINSSLWCETTWTYFPPDKSALHMVMGNPKGISLGEIESPFVYIEDDKGGHCPYGLPLGQHMGEGCGKFFEEYSKKGKEALKKQYKLGIEQSAENFKKRINILKERNLLDSTLIIFTSDHGELLGEYGGLIGHGRPPCAEMVYVPTVFIHPLLNHEYIDNKIIRHVDLFPTIASILNKRISYKVDGFDLTSSPFPSIGLNFKFGGYFKANNILKKLMFYNACGAWDSYGGHIFHGLSRNRALIFFLYKMFIQRHGEFKFMLEDSKKDPSGRFNCYKRALYQLTSPYIKSLNPHFSKDNANKIIEDLLKESRDFQEKLRIKNKINKLKQIGKISRI
jgi:hypothetical protein